MSLMSGESKGMGQQLVRLPAGQNWISGEIFLLVIDIYQKKMFSSDRKHLISSTAL